MIRISILFIFLFSTFAQAETSLQEKLDARKNGANKKRPAEVKKIMSDALAQLKSSGIEKAALQANTKVPSFKIDGKDISDFYRSGITIISFYRGSWCPYCMLQLKEYEKYYSEILQRGGKLIVLAPDTKKEIARTKKKFKLSFPIYSDQDNAIAKKFGLAFKMGEKLKALYKKFGIDIKKNQGNENFELPLPGTYVVNKQGKILFAFADADYTKRAEPKDLLKYLK